jgi:hypothetical protein
MPVGLAAQEFSAGVFMLGGNVSKHRHDAAARWVPEVVGDSDGRKIRGSTSFLPTMMIGASFPKLCRRRCFAIPIRTMESGPEFLSKRRERPRPDDLFSGHQTPGRALS